MKSNSPIHPDLHTVQIVAYQPSGFTLKNLVNETESKEYGACRFEMNNKMIAFRVAKITPTKIGQFVTLWKRLGDGPIMPYDLTDEIDLFVVVALKESNFGQFIFPKDLLWQKGFVSKNGKGGKRAMRIYPPWDIPESAQAKKTQSWQLPYFVEIKPIVDRAKMQKLLA